MNYKVTTGKHTGTVELPAGTAPLFIAATYIVENNPKSIGVLIEISGGEYSDDPVYVAGLEAFKLTGLKLS